MCALQGPSNAVVFAPVNHPEQRGSPACLLPAAGPGEQNCPAACTPARAAPDSLHHAAPATEFLELLASALSSFLLILPNTFQGSRHYYPQFKDKKLSWSLGRIARLSNSALQHLRSTHGTQQGPVWQLPCFWEGDMIFQVSCLLYPTPQPPALSHLPCHPVPMSGQLIYGFFQKPSLTGPAFSCSLGRLALLCPPVSQYLSLLIELGLSHLCLFFSLPNQIQGQAFIIIIFNPQCLAGTNWVFNEYLLN